MTQDDNTHLAYAIADLASLSLPKPTESAPRFAVWEVDPHGTGAIIARSARPEPLALARQIQGCLDYLAEEQPGARWIVAAVAPGMASKNRPDLSWIAAHTENGGLQWVCWSAPDRISRQREQATEVLDALAVKGIRARFAGADTSIAALRALFAAEERRAMADRIRRAIESRYLSTGQGLPQFVPLGLKRGKDGYLEPDPVTWPTAEWLFHEAASGQPDLSIAKLARLANAEFGTRLRPRTVIRCLDQPGYADGVYHYSYGGQKYTTHPVHLPKPIPRTIFDRARAFLRSQRRSR